MQECGGVAPDGLSGAFFMLQWEQDFVPGVVRRKERLRMSEPFVTLDLHGCTADQARVKVDAALRKADSGTYQIRCVHGFHGGTVIRDTIQYKYRSHPKVKRIMPGDNPGVTVLVLREL